MTLHCATSSGPRRRGGGALGRPAERRSAKNALNKWNCTVRFDRFGIRARWSALGWTAESWDGEVRGNSNDMAPTDLRSSQRRVTVICRDGPASAPPRLVTRRGTSGSALFPTKSNGHHYRHTHGPASAPPRPASLAPRSTTMSSASYIPWFNPRRSRAAARAPRRRARRRATGPT